MFSGHSSNGNCTQIVRRVSQLRELPVFFIRSISVTNKSNSRTCTVASSFASTSPLAHNHRRIFRYPHGLQFGFVEVFPADHVHACSGIYHNPSSGFIVDAASKVVFLFELPDFPGKSHASAGTSLLSCSLSWRSVLKFHADEESTDLLFL